MEKTSLFILVLIIGSSSFLLSYLFYRSRSKKFIHSFVDSQDNMIILMTEKKTILINTFGLNVFGHESMKSFHSSNVNILDSFIEEEGFLSKYTYREKWLKELLSSNTINIKTLEKKTINKVKIFSKKDMMERYYHIKVSFLKKEKMYIVSFTDISQLERDKVSLTKTAEYDPLTNIYNRVKLNSILETRFFDFNKYNHTFSIILFDIDHFKMVNDNYGHNVGDIILVSLSKLVKETLRNNDIFVRWGGEEFVILLQGVSLENTQKLASRLRLIIANNIFQEVTNVTCSFGVTEVSTRDTAESLFERVDKALYEAKENGRNKVVTKTKN